MSVQRSFTCLNISIPSPCVDTSMRGNQNKTERVRWSESVISGLEM